MIRRRTILITYATFIRLASLIGFLVLFSIWFDGAVVGAMATVAGMMVEAVYMVFVSRPFFTELRQRSETQASYGDFWKFSWPFMMTQVTENGVVFVLNLFLGRLANPDLALAAFGVVYALMRLILTPLRNLVHTTQALVHKREDLRAMFHFTFGLLLFYVLLIFFMFFTPLRGWILDVAMGLTVELSSYCSPAVKLMFLVAIFWSTAALLRGILAAMRKTGAIALTAGIRPFVLAGVGSVSLFNPDFNGASLGVLATAAAFAVEAAVLGWCLWCQSKVPGPMFPHHAAAV